MLSKPHYNSADLVDHEGVAAVIKNNQGEVLVFFHKKFEFWTIPIGKAESNESVYQGLCTELKEECGIDVIQAKEIATKQYASLREGKEIKLNSHVYEILEYSGEIINGEPNKHPVMKFVSIDELRNEKELSDATILYMETINSEIG